MAALEFNKLTIVAKTLNSIEAASCNLHALFPEIKQLGKDSSSPTVQFIASTGHQNINPDVFDKLPQGYITNRQAKGLNDMVFLKLYMTGVKRNEMDVELVLYKYLTESLVFSGVTPNIMHYIMDFRCGELAQTPDQQDLINQFAKINLTKVIKNPKYRAIVTEHGNGEKFVDFVKPDNIGKYWGNKTPLDLENDMMAIVFQIFYTCLEMHHAGVRHNDLHEGNVWIQIGDPITSEYYVRLSNTEAYSVKLKTRFTVKIYDFDRGTFTDISKLARNPKLDSTCKRAGECTVADRAHDLNHFLWRVTRRVGGLVNAASNSNDKNLGAFVTVLKKVFTRAINSFYTTEGIEELIENKNGLMTRPPATSGWFCSKDNDGFCEDVPIPEEYYYRNYLQMFLTNGGLLDGATVVNKTDVPERDYNNRVFVSQEIRPLSFTADLAFQ